jgi:hypothetical protein
MQVVPEQGFAGITRVFHERILPPNRLTLEERIMHSEIAGGHLDLKFFIGDIMAAPEQPGLQTQSYLVQCAPDTFDHAIWLSAVHSEVLFVSEEQCRLCIFPMTELLRGQFEKLGAVVQSIG